MIPVCACTCDNICLLASLLFIFVDCRGLFGHEVAPCLALNLAVDGAASAPRGAASSPGTSPSHLGFKRLASLQLPPHCRRQSRARPVRREAEEGVQTLCGVSALLFGNPENSRSCNPRRLGFHEFNAFKGDNRGSTPPRRARDELIAGDGQRGAADSPGDSRCASLAYLSVS